MTLSQRLIAWSFCAQDRFLWMGRRRRYLRPAGSRPLLECRLRCCSGTAFTTRGKRRPVSGRRLRSQRERPASVDEYLDGIHLRTTFRPFCSMVNSMATTKVTITLQDEQLEEIRALVNAGEAASVSGFVQHAVTVAVHDAAGWNEMLQHGLVQTGGPLTKKESVWADEILGVSKQKKGSRR